MRYLFCLKSLAAAGAMVLCGSARAGLTTTTYNFDLEDQPVSDPSALTSLTLGPGGVVTITAPDPQAFGIQDLSALGLPGAESLGARSIQPDLYDNPAPFTANFARPASSFSIDFADASDQTDQLSLKAFSGPNGTGSVVASQTGTLVSSLDRFSVKTLTVSGQGIESVQFVGGPPGSDQAFYDNLSVTTSSGGTAVPLPSSAAVFPLGAAMALLAGRRLKRQRI